VNPHTSRVPRMTRCCFGLRSGCGLWVFRSCARRRTRGQLSLLLSRWKTRPKDSPTSFTGAKPGGSGTVSKRLPRYADMSRSASAWKSPWCGGGQSLARKLLCGAECVMDLKWSDGDGKAQVRFHSGAASADDVSLYSQKTRGARPQNTPTTTRGGVHVRVFHATSYQSVLRDLPSHHARP
jgi:hypothetical protein